MPATTLDRVLPSFPSSAWTARLRWPQWLPALLLLALAALALATLPGHEPQVSRLQIDGRFNQVTPEAVRQAAATHMELGFFSVDVDAVRDGVTALPWVAQARVERIWPIGVRIRIWEREATARWNDDALLDGRSKVFRPDASDLAQERLAALPRLSGTPGNEALVARTWIALSQALETTPLALAALSLDARGEWTAQTRRGIELRLGPGAATDKIGALKTALPAALGERLSEVAYVDLRYTNGFAIGWAGRSLGESPVAGSLPQGRESAPTPDVRKGIKNG